MLSSVGTSPGRSLLYNSIRPSLSFLAESFSHVRRMVGSSLKSPLISLSEATPIALRSTVDGSFLFLSTCTCRILLLSCTNSSHAPLLGITVVSHKVAPFLSVLLAIYTPGERTSCDTTTRSAPLIIKLPVSVMRGKSPMNTSCSWISPVSLRVSLTLIFKGAA